MLMKDSSSTKRVFSINVFKVNQIMLLFWLDTQKTTGLSEIHGVQIGERAVILESRKIRTEITLAPLKTMLSLSAHDFYEI